MLQPFVAVYVWEDEVQAFVPYAVHSNLSDAVEAAQASSHDWQCQSYVVGEPLSGEGEVLASGSYDY